MTRSDLDKAIRRVANFPKPGITFYDITSLLADPVAFSYCLSEMAKVASGFGATAIGAIEARGFVFASAMAARLGLPLVLLRKKGKLPNPCRCQDFDLEYGSDTVCVQELDLVAGRRIHLVDDLIATGGTLAAASRLIEEAGLRVAGISAVIGLPFLGFPQVLAGRQVETLLSYQHQ